MENSPDRWSADRPPLPARSGKGRAGILLPVRRIFAHFSRSTSLSE